MRGINLSCGHSSAPLFAGLQGKISCGCVWWRERLKCCEVRTLFLHDVRYVLQQQSETSALMLHVRRFGFFFVCYLLHLWVCDVQSNRKKMFLPKSVYYCLFSSLKTTRRGSLIGRLASKDSGVGTNDAGPSEPTKPRSELKHAAVYRR